jgi:RimJ/RimL family protein N-acetyltransferase
VREWTRWDVDRLASWPLYPFPYRGFEFSFAGMGTAERDRLFRTRQDQADAFVLVVDHCRGARMAIGYLALRSIDWEAGIIGNVGMRVHPAWCNRGVGTSMLGLVTRWSFEHGMARWRLDVAASNARAVNCYREAGFVPTSERWRDASHLAAHDLRGPRFDFLRPHLRGLGDRIELRFWVMELEVETRLEKEVAV